MGKKKDPTEIHQSARFTMFIKRLQELLPSRAQIAHRLNGLVTVSAVDAWVARESLPRVDTPRPEGTGILGSPTCRNIAGRIQRC